MWSAHINERTFWTKKLVNNTEGLINDFVTLFAFTHAIKKNLSWFLHPDMRICKLGEYYTPCPYCGIDHYSLRHSANEGNVNRFKNSRRLKYGRVGFEFLCRKVVLSNTS